MARIFLQGGFHNASETYVKVSNAAAQSVLDGFSSLSEILSDSQKARLEKHFCGCKDCHCGSYARVEIRVELDK